MLKPERMRDASERRACAEWHAKRHQNAPVAGIIQTVRLNFAIAQRLPKPGTPMPEPYICNSLLHFNLNCCFHKKRKAFQNHIWGFVVNRVRVHKFIGRIPWFTNRIPWFTDRSSWLTDRILWFTGGIQWFTDRKPWFVATDATIAANRRARRPRPPTNPS